jgi:hypothetical protein
LPVLSEGSGLVRAVDAGRLGDVATSAVIVVELDEGVRIVGHGPPGVMAGDRVTAVGGRGGDGLPRFDRA